MGDTEYTSPLKTTEKQESESVQNQQGKQNYHYLNFDII